MKKGFTLIEIMIVLAIIGIITAMTMGFGGNRVKQLKQQSAKSLFVNTFEQLRSSALTSSFHNKKNFEKFTIQLANNHSDLYYSYHFDALNFVEYYEKIDSDISIENIKLYNDELNEINNNDNTKLIDVAILNIKPYELTCGFSTKYSDKKISNNQNSNGYIKGILSFELHIKNSNKKYCFIIPSKTCRIIETKCDTNLLGNTFISNLNDED